MTRIVIGAPAWDRAWALPLWFQSVRRNVNPAETGLVFVVPPTDSVTRNAIATLSDGFDWVEVLRDRGEQSRRADRAKDGHATLAAARNQILQVVGRVRPERYVSWDTDLLMPPGSVKRAIDADLPLVAGWTWLNRQPAQELRWRDGDQVYDVWWQPPVQATAMMWDPSSKNRRPMHYPGHEFRLRASRRAWRCDVALAWQVMDRRAYLRASYGPHPDGEDVGFCAQLQAQGVPRWCIGSLRGVHLYDEAANEARMGWPDVMRLSDHLPLPTVWSGERPAEYEAFGLYPRGDE